MDRRNFIRSCGVAGTFLLGGCLGASRDLKTSPLGDSLSVNLRPIVDGLTEPLALSFGPDGINFIGDKVGKIYSHDSNGNVNTILDLTDRVEVGYEKGFLGLTLHPNFENNHRLFVRYSGALREDSPSNYSHTFVLSEFTTNSDYMNIDPETERIILEIPQPVNRHQGGDLEFGPDGFLYVTIGDGVVWTDNDRGPEWLTKVRHGQKLSTLPGSILRIDVDHTSGTKEYAIPNSNPLTDEHGRDEIYAWGFRNPWQISFSEGDLFVGDVGGNGFEEISIVKKGGNYGWRIKEGLQCKDNVFLSEYLRKNPLGVFNPGFISSFVTSEMGKCVNWTDDELIDPVITYWNSGNENKPSNGIVGKAVICGYRYMDSANPALENLYIFGDLRKPGEPFGQLFAADPTENGLWPLRRISNSKSANGLLDGQLFSISQDPEGGLYALTTKFQEGTGKVSQIV